MEILKQRLPQLYSQGYADDLGILQAGKDLPTVTNLMQQGLNLALKWCKKVDLGINASKVISILFTHNRKFKIKPLIINMAEIAFRSEVRYLGVILDCKLTWMPHCRAKARKCTVALAQCKRAFGKTWGWKPSTCYWIYTAVIRPVLAYAATVWLPAVEKQCALYMLQRVQRMALVNMFGVMRSTPTAAMECLAGMHPIDLYLKGSALAGMSRLKKSGHWLDWRGFGHTARRTHVQVLTELQAGVPEVGLPTECKARFLPVERLFEVEIKSRRDWENCGSPSVLSPGISCFTDGSKKEDGGTGAACYFPGSPEKGFSFPLGKYSTVYQAEVVAIIRAAELLLEPSATDVPVSMFVDSSSALKSLTSSLPVTELVRECFEALNCIAQRRKIALHWIPAHCGYSGNEAADGLAKQAAEMLYVGPQPSLPLSQEAVNSAIVRWMREQHRTEWQKRLDCVQTKRLVAYPEIRVASYIRGLRRDTLRVLTQVITGHCPLNAHLTRIGILNSAICPSCRGGVETRDHFLFECDAHCRLRLELLSLPFLAPQDQIDIPLPVLNAFIKRTGRFQRDTEE